MTPVPPHQADEAPTVQFGAVRAEPSPAAQTPRFALLPDAASNRRNWRRILLAGALTAVLLLAGGAWAYASAGDVPRGTSVLGIDIGGMSRAEARAALEAALTPRLAAPVQVRLDGENVPIKPDAVGLRLDVPATVEAAADGGLTLWGSRQVEPVTRVDEAKLGAALRKALDPAKITMKKPGIRYSGLTPRPTYPEPGHDLDPARAAELVRAGWLTGGPIDVPLVERPPVTTREQVDQMIAELAQPAVAAPVQVVTERGGFTVPPAAIAKSLVFTADSEGALSAKLDAKKLRAAVASELATVEVEPEEARIALAGGKPRVVASTPGTAVDLGKLTADIFAVLPQADGRQVTATFKTQQAETTDEDLLKLGIKQKVSSFTTRFTGGLSSPRSQNIVTIAKEVDGAVVKPGEVFSLNAHTGVRGYEQGYKDAPVILDGKLEPGVGGGASQFTTTLFNAAYYAGLEDVEHKPHSFYFSRYPAVIESTIFYPNLDLKFRNNTPYGILIDTSYTSKTITVSMWSTKYYDSVKTKYGPRRNHTSPQTVYRDPGPKCIATDGLPGFTQDAWRIFRKDGKEIKREKFSWRYDPEPRFICGKKPS